MTNISDACFYFMACLQFNLLPELFIHTLFVFFIHIIYGFVLFLILVFHSVHTGDFCQTRD